MEVHSEAVECRNEFQVDSKDSITGKLVCVWKPTLCRQVVGVFAV